MRMLRHEGVIDELPDDAILFARPSWPIDITGPPPYVVAPDAPWHITIHMSDLSRRRYGGAAVSTEVETGPVPIYEISWWEFLDQVLGQGGGHVIPRAQIMQVRPCWPDRGRDARPAVCVTVEDLSQVLVEGHPLSERAGPGEFELASVEWPTWIRL